MNSGTIGRNGKIRHVSPAGFHIIQIVLMIAITHHFELYIVA
jgi:hypothetical protein